MIFRILLISNSACIKTTFFIRDMEMKEKRLTQRRDFNHFETLTLNNSTLCREDILDYEMRL